MTPSGELLVIYSRHSARRMTLERLQALATRLVRDGEQARIIRVFVMAPFLNEEAIRIRTAIAGALDPMQAYALVDQSLKPWLQAEVYPLWTRLGRDLEKYRLTDLQLRAMVLSVAQWDRFLRRLARDFRQSYAQALPIEQDERVPVATPLVIECRPERREATWRWKEQPIDTYGRRKVVRVYSLDLVSRYIVGGSDVFVYPREEEMLVPPDAIHGIAAMIDCLRPTRAIYCGPAADEDLLESLTPGVEWSIW